MKKIRVLIVDDEPLAREGVEAMLAIDPEIEIVGLCGDGQTGLEAIRLHQPDLVFLDIQMPRLNGFEVLAALKSGERPVIIFITAFDKYAIKAFECFAFDYLLKPYRDARFYAALARAKSEIGKAKDIDMSDRLEKLLGYVKKLTSEPGVVPTTPPPVSAPNDKLVLKTGSDLNFIKSADIVWIEAQADFVKVHSVGQARLVRETLQSLEERLDPARFVRIHRSSLVNLDYVKKVTPALYGDYTVLLNDGTNLKLSRGNRAKLKQLMGLRVSRE
ncbi:LytR/AlgR family response regulator transcription factor [Oleiharenicola lentus]|uniref:LytR/AlgR family response regulator transcription factor n=1 Tax=Oleiharenicola lentus TaxID=2508720 RepID=UPI003F67A809